MKLHMGFCFWLRKIVRISIPQNCNWMEACVLIDFLIILYRVLYFLIFIHRLLLIFCSIFVIFFVLYFRCLIIAFQTLKLCAIKDQLNSNCFNSKALSSAASMLQKNKKKYQIKSCCNSVLFWYQNVPCRTVVPNLNKRILH